MSGSPLSGGDQLGALVIVGVLIWALLNSGRNKPPPP